MKRYLKYKSLVLPLAILQLLLIEFSLLYRHSHEIGTLDILSHVHYIDYSNSDDVDHTHTKSEYLALQLFSDFTWIEHHILSFLPPAVWFSIEVLFDFYESTQSVKTRLPDIRGSPLF